jgi:hypothetical protein
MNERPPLSYLVYDAVISALRQQQQNDFEKNPNKKKLKIVLT